MSRIEPSSGAAADASAATGSRRAEYDVSDEIRVTDPAAVAAETARLFRGLYAGADAQPIARYFGDFTRFYAGEDERYHPADTPYHDVQHVLDVTLAMARLMAGRERQAAAEPLGERLFRFGIVLALFHDAGYLRHRKDSRHRYGAEYTLTHVARGGSFLKDYLRVVDFADLAPAATQMLHYTGYEIPIARIRAPAPVFRELGCMLGTADIRAQMADRCYLEKCYDRLYTEFVLGGIARRRTAGGRTQIVFASAADLISKTPQFHENARLRLDNELEGVHRHFRGFFRGDDPYLDFVERNIGYAQRLHIDRDMSGLRRRPPHARAMPAQLTLT